MGNQFILPCHVIIDDSTNENCTSAIEKSEEELVLFVFA